MNAGKQTSSATENNVSLNQSNFATVDSVAAGEYGYGQDLWKRRRWHLVVEDFG